MLWDDGMRNIPVQSREVGESISERGMSEIRRICGNPGEKRTSSLSPEMGLLQLAKKFGGH